MYNIIVNINKGVIYMGKKKTQYKEIKAFIEGPEGNGCKLLTTKKNMRVME